MSSAEKSKKAESTEQMVRITRPLFNFIIRRKFYTTESKDTEFIQKINSIKVEKEIDEKSLLKELFSEENSEASTNELKEKTKIELEELLKIAVQNENYESAAKIRDEISNR